MPPVGKSGPLMNCIKSATEHSFLCAIYHLIADATSVKLCDTKSLLNPTAIPLLFPHNKNGNFDGKVIGSTVVSS